MFELSQNSKPDGDGRTFYDIRLNGTYTIGEFIKDALTLSDYYGFIFYNDHPIIVYRYGNIVADYSNANILASRVDTATAMRTGWTNVEYYIESEEEILSKGYITINRNI